MWPSFIHFYILLGYARRPVEIYSEDIDDVDPAVMEQFTVVFMTYKRHSLIKDAIALFKGIRELHRVVIIWNDVEHAPDMEYDLNQYLNIDKHASIVIVSPNANSLNNRLVPYEVIETECILQIDDDTRYLTKDQIKHGFRLKYQVM